jgi:hypothetical protein
LRTVTDNFEQEQRREGNIVTRGVQYKRRYWSQANNAYTWETSWTDLPESLLSNISPVNWQLDSDTLNEFKVSNVTLVLNNSLGKFFFTNPFGIFGPDSSSHRGYEPYWTKFRIRAGYLLPDGTEEMLTLFTGVVTEWTFESSNRTVQATVQGLEATLVNSNAEDIATDVSQETPTGTVNGVNTEFTTLNPGVGGVTLVTVDGISQVDGEDYTVSQLNDPTLGAKVTFEDPPDVGEVVKITYFYWPQSLQFHEIVEALLDAAGIPSANQEVEEVSFENSVINSFPFTSQADWNSGTLTKMDAAVTPGSVVAKSLLDSAYTESTTWSTSLSGWTVGTAGITTDGTNLQVVGSGAGFIYRASTRNTGTWAFTFNKAVSLTSIIFAFFTNTTSFNSQYQLEVGSGSLLLRKDLTGIASYTNSAINSGNHTIVISRVGDGRFRVFYDGTQVIDITDTTYSTHINLGIRIQSITAETVSVREIYIPSDTDEITWVSPTNDIGSVPSAWEDFSTVDDANGATITYATRSSTDGISWDAWADLSGTGTVQSALKRYVQIRATVDAETITESDRPEIQEIVLRAVTSSVGVTLPAFTGLNIYEAIQAIGTFTNFEFGFDEDEHFFFRSKTVGNSVLDVHEGNFLTGVNQKSGYERVYGGVRATYGDIVRLITDDGLFKESPKARVSNRIYDIQADSNIVIPTSADIATGIARGLFEQLKLPRSRAKINTKFLPQLELSDVITVRAVQALPIKKWWMGDNDVNLGDAVDMWGEGEQMLFDAPAKIIAARYDVQNAKCEFDIEEVI